MNPTASSQPDFFGTFLQLLGSHPFFAFVFWTFFCAGIALIALVIVRYILHKIFAVPLALKKKVLKILVPKEPAKKEEEEKSSKKDYKELIAVAESFYAALGQVKPRWRPKAFFIGREDQIALEIVALEGLIRFYAVVPEYLQSFLEQQLQAQYSSAQIEEVPDYNLFSARGFISCAPLVLTRESIFPLKTYKKMDSDPLNAVTNAMSKIENGQGAAIQIMIRTSPKGWRARAHHVARSMQKGKSLEEALGGKTIFAKVYRVLNYVLTAVMHTMTTGKEKEMPGAQSADKTPFPKLSPMEQELIKSMEEKAGKVAFEANIRVVASAGTEKTAKMHTYNIANVFAQYLGPESGVQLKKQKRWQYWKGSFLKSFIYRRFDDNRKFIISTEELASIFHLPLSTTETPTIEWLKARGAPPPQNLPKEGILIGESIYRGRQLSVRLQPEDRRRHMYIIGMTGSGKSTVMENMIVQDIREGSGCCYIDPHGEAIERILGCIPPQRADDVVLFEPGDVDRPIGLNMLEADTPHEVDFAIQEMIAIFYKLVTDPSMIGPMFEHYMRNAMLTLMSNPSHPGTIVEIPRILTDKDYQKYKLKTVTDPIVRAFWEKELPQTAGQTKGEMLPYLVSKIGRFIENSMMRNIIGQERSGFNLREVMDAKKILLVNLSKGQVGEMNSNLLGLIIVSKLQMAALARANMPEEERHDFYLYIDEFQNFITDSISTILSEARKYRLDLVLAHQYIAQLSPKQGDTKVRDAVFGNVGTIMCYRVGVDDSELMAKQMAPVFNEFDVMNIDRFHAYIRLLINNTAARPFNIKPQGPIYGDKKIAQAIRQLSRLKYGRDRALVENEILERSQLAGDTIDYTSTWD